MSAESPHWHAAHQHAPVPYLMLLPSAVAKQTTAARQAPAQSQMLSPQMLSPAGRSLSRCPELLRLVSCAPLPAPPAPPPPLRFGPPKTGCDTAALSNQLAVHTGTQASLLQRRHVCTTMIGACRDVAVDRWSVPA